jgi:hypothetical protein
MLTFDATGIARLSASEAGLHVLIDLDFSTGHQYVTTSSVPISHGGNTYTALGDVIELGEIKQSEDQSRDKLDVSFPITNSAMLAQLIGPATVYRNRKVLMYAQPIGPTFQADGAAVLFFAGFMDVVKVDREDPNPEAPDEFVGGKVTLPIWRAGMARMRTASGLRRTHAQQMQRTSNADTGLRYTQQLIEQPSLWVSKRFQEITS